MGFSQDGETTGGNPWLFWPSKSTKWVILNHGIQWNVAIRHFETYAVVHDTVRMSGEVPLYPYAPCVSQKMIIFFLIQQLQLWEVPSGNLT